MHARKAGSFTAGAVTAAQIVILEARSGDLAIESVTASLLAFPLRVRVDGGQDASGRHR